MADYELVRWREKDIAYKIHNKKNLEVLGVLVSEGNYSPLEKKLEKKFRAYIRGSEISEKLDPKANIYFKKFSKNYQ